MNKINCTFRTFIHLKLNKYKCQFFIHIHSLSFVQDGEGRLLSIYSKFDVINLAAEKTYDDLEVLHFLFLKFRNIVFMLESETIFKKILKVTLRDANSHKSGWFEGVHNCRWESITWLYIGDTYHCYC